MQRVVDRLTPSPDYAAFVANLSAANTAPKTAANTATTAHATFGGDTRSKASADQVRQQRLDDFRDSFSGPNRIAGTSVMAPPMFRMNGESCNSDQAKAHAPALFAICKKAGLAKDVGPVSMGRGTPAQLVHVTQALLDAGKLPPADDQHQTTADRIKGMQWDWGIGVDCAGYTQQAAAVAHPDSAKAFLSNVYGDVFSDQQRPLQYDPKSKGPQSEIFGGSFRPTENS